MPEENAHACNQEEVIARHGVLLERIGKATLGNGTPEDGMLFRFRVFMEEHKAVVNDIADIKTKLSTVTEINTELETQRRVKTELEKRGIREEDSEHKKQTLNWQRIGVIVAMFAFVTMAIFQGLSYFNTKDTKEVVTTTKEKVLDLGTPYVSNPRGEVVNLPQGYKVKMWGKELTDSTNLK